jgi:type I site-specific restriction-modification system R (restriction) subunit
VDIQSIFTQKTAVNYIDITEATKATGKNQMTIRRLIKKPQSQPYVKIEKKEGGDKYTIDVNYLFSVYTPINNVSTPPIQQDIQRDLERLLREKDERIKDLKEQLEKKDKIIDNLTDTMKLLPQASVISNHPKPSWFNRFFGNKNAPLTGMK